MSISIRALPRYAALGACTLLLLALRPALADDPLSVILGDSTPPLMNSLNLIAQGAGFYHDEHLLVTTVLVNGTDKVMDACTSGTADICPIGIEAAITAYGQGKQLKMFLTRASKFGYVLLASRTARSSRWPTSRARRSACTPSPAPHRC